MSIIKCNELLYIRRSVPDVSKIEAFLVDFGLIPAARQGSSVYLRGTDPVHHCYILEEGPARLLGFAFAAKSEADLHTLAKATGCAVEAIDEPGGGQRVRLQEPNGYAVDIVFGMATPAAIAVARQPVNTGSEPLRRRELLRLPRGKATPLKRIAHVVLGTPKVAETAAWFRDTLGMLPSDEVFRATGEAQIASFLRVDKGDEYVDHHAFLPMRSDDIGLQHVSFESQDIDAVMADHHFLQSLGYEHLWGIGRHLLGSQLFDYWNDPLGYAHEHWADSDRLSASAPTGVWEAKEGMVTQWGEPATERFRHNVKP
ncbi:VOC family protein [Cupriavidus plantarum]|uniref:VOC family protein n=1 Tax=Cupriavidus plantarum TaxID=942865 RepID=UPI000EAD05F1|nr:VOC family protein [Cupriavidus plantarum]RLK45243.1 catechol 2,3-dioxygenase-like lactoylglutathione lyase family enzyme [Cupriavidus plantarum]